MKLAFILPGNDDKPYGGYRIVYEYAARLSHRGHDVTIIYPAVRRLNELPRRVLARIIRRPWRHFGNESTSVSWFPFPPDVVLRRPAGLGAGDIEGFDVLVATAWDTAEDLLRLPAARTRGLYLIQSDEHWSGPAARVERTWRSGFAVVVIAEWLRLLAIERGLRDVALIPNAIDTHTFRITRPPCERAGPSIAMLSHPDHVKGTDVGIRALELVRDAVPDVAVTLFGFDARPVGLPSWCDYVRSPSREMLVALLNDVTVFLSPSRLEGWALPPAEAMCCGCAVVATDIGGHRDYGIDRVTALMVPPEDAEALAAATCQLLEDEPLRIALAERGARMIRDDFSWERSVNAFESVLTEVAARRSSD